MPYGSDPTTPPQGQRRSTLEMAPPAETPPRGDSPPGMPADAAAPPSGLDQLWQGLNPIGTAHAAYGSDPTTPPPTVPPPQTGGYGRDPRAPPASPPQQPAPQQQQPGGMLSALWEGLKHGGARTALGVSEMAHNMPDPISALTGLGESGRQKLLAETQGAIGAGERAFAQNPTVKAHPLAAGTGQVLGEVATTAPLAMLPGGAAMRGAGLGARAMQGAIQGGLGAMTAPVGEGRDYWQEKEKQLVVGGALGGGLGAMLGRRAPMGAQPGQQFGLQATPGAAAGGQIARIEATMRAYPIVGNMISNAQVQSATSFRRAAGNQALEPIGQQVSGRVADGHGLINEVRDKLGAAYDRVKPNITLTEDAALTHELGQLGVLTREMSDDHVRRYNQILDNTLYRRFGKAVPAGPPRSIDGQSFKEVESEIHERIRKLSGSANDAELAHALQETLSIVRDHMARQNPIYGNELKNINYAYSMYLKMVEAAQRDIDGKFSPQQLFEASRKLDYSAHNNKTARGVDLMHVLAQAGKAALGPTPRRADAHTHVHGMLHELWRLGTGAAAAVPYAAAGQGAAPGAMRGAPVGLAAPIVGRLGGDELERRKSYYSGRGYQVPDARSTDRQ